MAAAYLILLLAVFSRVLPALFHVTGGNVTLLGAGLLFFGSRLAPQRHYLVLCAGALIALSDAWLTVYAYGYPFHIVSYLPTWLWYGAVCLLASAGLRRVTVPRVVLAALASSTGFFLLSNGMVWMRSGMYPHTGADLGACYVAGLPFYRNDLVSTLTFSAVFFALPWARAALDNAARGLHDHTAA